MSFSESSPLSLLCHFLPPFPSIWPLTSQGPPAYAASAGLLSNQILTVKVCPSQLIIPCPCSQTSVPHTLIYLTLFFHFSFVPTTLYAEGRWCKLNLFLQLWLLPLLLSFLFTLSIFLIICPLQIDGLPLPWAWLSLDYSWPPHFSQAPSKSRAGFVHACLAAFLISLVSLASISSSGSLQCCVACLFRISKRG